MYTLSEAFIYAIFHVLCGSELYQNAVLHITEDADKEIIAVADGVYNFLLEGDNLHSLRLLEKTHKGRIDVIYIEYWISFRFYFLW